MDGAPAAEFPSGDDSLPIDSALLKVLAADSRRDILRLLKTRRMTLTELSGQLNLKKATVLEHLKKLTDANLIRRMEDERLWVYYELTRQGSRIVTPGKTRFYLIMSATALAGLLIGGIIVAALIYQAPHIVDVKQAPGTPAHSVADQAGAPSALPGAPQANAGAEPTLGLRLDAPAYAWRGIDNDLTLRINRTSAPVDGALLLASPTAAPLTLYATGGVAHLAAGQLDSLAAANYSVQFAPSGANATWTPIGSLELRDPAIVVDPVWVVENVSTTFNVRVPPGTAPPIALERMAQLASASSPTVLSFTAPPLPAGHIDISVGRLYHVDVEVAPDAAVTVGAWDGAAWPIEVLRNGTPVQGATVAFGTMAPQLTNATGAARLAPSGAIPQELRIAFADGASASRALVVDEHAVTAVDPTAQVDAFRATPVGDALAADAVLSNRGSTDARVVLTVVVDGSPAGSQFALVRAGATGATFTTRAPIALANGAHQAELRIAPGPLLRVTTSTSAAESSAPSSTSSDTTLSSATPSPAPVYQGMLARSTAAAMTTFYVGPMSPTATTVAATSAAPASYGPAKVPGAPLGITLALSLALALALRRRRG